MCRSELFVAEAAKAFGYLFVAEAAKAFGCLFVAEAAKAFGCRAVDPEGVPAAGGLANCCRRIFDVEDGSGIVPI